MVYAVIDTNILVSAFISKNQTSATKRVVRNVFSHNIKPLYNDEILAEYSDVLHRSKFHLEDSEFPSHSPSGDSCRDDGDIGQ